MSKRATVLTVSLLWVPLSVMSCGPQGEEARASVASAEAQVLHDSARVFEAERISAEDFRAAGRLYRAAIEIDSSFAAAHAGLARIHAGMVHFMYDPTEERRSLSKQAAEAALGLQPESSEAHFAMGTYWYWGMKQYDSAAAHLAVATQLMPNDGDVLAMAGYVERRRGNWQQALDYLQRAAAADPRADFNTNLADIYAALGRLDEGLEAYRTAQRLSPAAHYEVNRGLLLLQHGGGGDSLRVALQGLPAGFDPDGIVTLARYELALAERRPDDALSALSASSQPILQNQEEFFPLSLLAGRAHRLAGRTAEARSAFDSARIALQAAAAEHPDDARIQAALASALAGLGQATASASAAERALTLMPKSRDAFIAQNITRQAAAAYADLGQHDRAVELLEDLFAEPAIQAYSRRYLAIDPTWEPLRNNPAFQRIGSGG
jgi:serine/threonine-protein kinase